MGYKAQEKRDYTRPEIAKDYLTYGKVLQDHRDNLRTMYTPLPAIAKAHPLNFSWYDESTSVSAAKKNIICGGQPILIPAGTNGTTFQMVGILTKDTEAGTDGIVAIEGRHIMRAEYDADADHTISALDSTLHGKFAYLAPESGLVTDDATAGLRIGRFDFGDGFGKPREFPISGLNWMPVTLDPALMDSTAVAAPADGTTAPSNELFAEVTISDFVGLNQILDLTAMRANPNYEINDATIVWTLEGTAQPNGTTTASYTGTAGTGKTISVTVTWPDGATITKNYTVTMSASAAPSAFTEV